MPYCPECQAEYRAEVSRCRDCDRELVDSLPESVDEETGLELVELAVFPNFSEAEMIKELIEGNQIRTVLRGETDPIGTASGAAPVTLLVEKRDEERARELYDAYFAGKDVVEESETGDTA